MKRLALGQAVVGLLAIVVGLVCWSMVATNATSDPPSTIRNPKSSAAAAERFLPDWGPRVDPYEPDDADRGRTIYAQRIVLRGRDCQITLDAASRQPGITIQSTRSNERVQLYVNHDGRAVIGVASPQRKDLVAALWSDQGRGLLQIAESNGVHVLSGSEIAGQR